MKQQRGRGITQTHVCSSRTKPPPQTVVNRQLKAIINFMGNEPVVEEEDDYTENILEIEGHV